jgi:hypothetical protein
MNRSIEEIDKQLTIWSILLSLTICYLVWALFLYVKLYFGHEVVNKLTFMPFKWAFGNLCLMTVVWGTVTYGASRYGKAFLRTRVFKYITFPCFAMGQFSQYAFVIGIIYEYSALMRFIIFQRSVSSR